jgi:isopenicillin N synthase-like dioxygenase
MPTAHPLGDSEWVRMREDRYVSFSVSEEIALMVRSVYEAGDSYFDLNLAQKASDTLSSNAGYRPYGVERSRNVTDRDEIESFSVTRRVPSSLLKSQEAKDLALCMSKVFDSLETLAEGILWQFASHFSVTDPLKFRGGLHKWSYLQLNRRHAIAGKSNGFSSDTHEDACLFTLMSNTGPGLEIEDSSGNFVPVSPSEDQFILFPGSVLSLLSGAHFPPTYHRVRTIPGEERRKALLLFAELDLSLCEPWIRNEANEGINIKDFVLNSPTHHGLQPWSFDE